MAAVKQVASDLIALEGELKFPVIVKARRQIEKQLAQAKGEMKVDFAGVTDVDSSALSFWLCCLRFAQKQGVNLQALNFPEDMKGIARLVGLEATFS